MRLAGGVGLFRPRQIFWKGIDMLFRSRISLFAALFVFLASPLSGYDLKPIVIQLSPTGTGASQNVLITNTHNVPIAIEVRAYKRSQRPDGTEERVAEDEDLIISPPQMVIAPKASQSFQVRWVGDQKPEKELAFRLVTKQLPIKFKDQKKGEVSVKVDMSYSYEAALYVVPPQSTPSARLAAAKHVADDQGKSWLELKFASEGSRRAILKNPVLDLSTLNGGAKITLQGDAVKAIANLNLLVGSERVVRLPWPEGLPKGEVAGTLRTEYTVFN
jgi:fimbrial chaperone protein